MHGDGRLPRPWLAALLVVSSAAWADAGTPDAGTGEPFVRRTRELMHTRVAIALPWSMDAAAREAAFAEAFAVFEAIEVRLNEWRPDSPLSRVNAGAGGKPVEAPADVCDVVSLALEGARKTGGLFDPTWAALKEVWRLGSDETGEAPSDEALAKVCPLVNWKAVELKPLTKPTAERACTIRPARLGMRLGLGGVVKGWGVDQVVKRLRSTSS
ncbi:MAG: hypothetical protein AMXMBFR34_12990 [Myxococcaceae bacterium]